MSALETPAAQAVGPASAPASAPDGPTLRLILGDQLDPQHPWYREPRPDVVYLLLEMRQETDYVVHHAQKVIAIFAAMRDFARQLKATGHRVRHVAIDDASNRQSLTANLDALIAHYGASAFEWLLRDEWRLDAQLSDWAARQSIACRAVGSCHFHTARGGAPYAGGRGIVGQAHGQGDALARQVDFDDLDADHVAGLDYFARVLDELVG